MTHSTYTTARTGDLHDFDFFTGTWTVHNRRLTARGVGCDDWEQFPATSNARQQLGGIVHLDEMHCPTKGWTGLAIRSFHLGNRQWSIRWVDSRTGAMDPPVVGGFEGDRGEFYGEDTHDGRPVKVRFQWTKLGPDRARWEQAFAFDDHGWEVNWVMEFTRLAPMPVG